VRRRALEVSDRQRDILALRGADALRSELLRGMRRRGGAPLRVHEKLDAMRAAAAAYRRQAAAMRPAWAPISDAEVEAEEEVERRLWSAQFDMEGAGHGRSLRSVEAPRGLSVNLEPALRLVLRPAGLGSLQVFADGRAGPPGQQVPVSVGIVNDRSLADVYREHPVPAAVALQAHFKAKTDVR